MAESAEREQLVAMAVTAAQAERWSATAATEERVEPEALAEPVESGQLQLTRALLRGTAALAVMAVTVVTVAIPVLHQALA